MLLQDWIGFIGVCMLLLAFLLNLLKKINMDSVAYTALNTVGAGLTCTASILIPYWPFIILEAIWTVVSAVALLGSLRKE
jgi:hypothetical protein